MLLAFLHALHVPAERHRLAILGVGRLETEQLGKLLTVLGIFDDTELDSLAKGLGNVSKSLRNWLKPFATWPEPPPQRIRTVRIENRFWEVLASPKWSEDLKKRSLYKMDFSNF